MALDLPADRKSLKGVGEVPSWLTDENGNLSLTIFASSNRGQSSNTLHALVDGHVMFTKHQVAKKAHKEGTTLIEAGGPDGLGYFTKAEFDEWVVPEQMISPKVKAGEGWYKGVKPEWISP